MKISIIVPIYQFSEDLAQLSRNMFESLNKVQTNGDEIEKIIIDNGSSVGVEDLKNNADIYIRNKSNLGYCRAVNQGYKLATGDIMVIGNNDIRVSSNFLSIAKDILINNPKAASVHFRMLPYEEPFWYGLDTWIGGKERWCHSSLYVIRKEAIPTDLYWEGYKEGGYDDYDFWHRIRDVNGWKQIYTNKAAFQHRDSSTYMALDARDGNRSERDIRNRESYKQRFGEYPDVQFTNLFPDQMKVPWKPFP